MLTYYWYDSSISTVRKLALPTVTLFSLIVSLARADDPISLAPQAACTIVGNVSGSSGAPTAVALGSGLACSNGEIIATGGGSGDVVGPESAMDSNLAAFNTMSGKLLKDSGLAIGSLVPTSRIITAGTGLSGGGDLSADRTLSLEAGAAVANLGFTPPPNTRSIGTSGLLTGGGDLSADRTIAIAVQGSCTIVANATGGSAAPTA